MTNHRPSKKRGKLSLQQGLVIYEDCPIQASIWLVGKQRERAAREVAQKLFDERTVGVERYAHLYENVLDR